MRSTTRVVGPLPSGSGWTLGTLLGRSPRSAVSMRAVEPARRASRTDRDRLRFVIDADAGESPTEAVSRTIDGVGRLLAEIAGCTWPPIQSGDKAPAPAAPSAAIASAGVAGLGLRVRTVLALQGRGIATVGDLVRTPALALLQTPLLGRRQLEEIQDALAAIGLSLVRAPGRAPPSSS